MGHRFHCALRCSMLHTYPCAVGGVSRMCCVRVAQPLVCVEEEGVGGEHVSAGDQAVACLVGVQLRVWKRWLCCCVGCNRALVGRGSGVVRVTSAWLRCNSLSRPGMR